MYGHKHSCRSCFHHWGSAPNGGDGGGFTLPELLVTLGILALVTALAVPGMRAFVQNNRAATEANALTGALSLARNEAVTRGVPVTVCASADGATCSGAADWSTGWIVFTDPNGPLGEVNDGDPADTVLRSLPALLEGSTLAGSAPAVSYAPTGFLGAVAAVNFQLEIPDCTGQHNRTISVSPQGRVAVATAACGGEDG